MKFLFLTLALLCVALNASNPSLKADIKLDFINTATFKLLPMIKEAITTQQVPDIHQEIKVILLKYYIDLTSIKLGNLLLNGDQIKISFVNNQIMVNINNLGADVSANLKVSGAYAASGTLAASVRNTNVALGLSVSVSSTNHFQVAVTSFSINIGKFDVSVKGNFGAWLLNIILQIGKGIVKSQVQKQIGEALRTNVIQTVNQILSTLPTTIQYEKFHLGFTYQPNSAPVFQPDQVLAELFGYAFDANVGSQKPPLPDPAAFPAVAQTEACQFFISDYLINSLFYSLQSDNHLKINITNEMLPIKLPIKLTTDALVELFPEVVQRYGSQNVSLGIDSARQPVVKITPDNFTGTFDLGIDLNLEGQNVRIATLDFQLDYDASVYLDNNTLKFKYVDARIGDVSIINTNMTGFDTKVIQEVLNFGIKLVLPVIEKEVLSIGVPLPTLKGITLNNLSIKFVDNAIEVQVTPDIVPELLDWIDIKAALKFITNVLLNSFMEGMKQSFSKNFLPNF